MRKKNEKLIDCTYITHISAAAIYHICIVVGTFPYFISTNCLLFLSFLLILMNMQIQKDLHINTLN